MPEVTSVCVDSSTQSNLSCVAETPYTPLYAFTLEIELVDDVWTEFEHYDSHTFGPFDLEEEADVDFDGDGDFGDVTIDE